MKHEIKKHEIIVYDLKDFNINQILDCGQIFRYQIDGDCAVVFSKDKKAVVETFNDKVVIKTDNVDYFENFFDLKTDYSAIKQNLKDDKYLKNAIKFGYGIRILKNDAYEMIVSFIISANNNISRIKKSIEYLCSNFGSNMGDYFAFPTLDQLKTATIEDFKKAGLGYRAEYMYETVQNLTLDQIEILKSKSRQEQFNFLVSLKGVGEKVANCIMLFGLSVKDVFPVDTWINKVYNKINNKTETDRKKIAKEFIIQYGDLSGYAQQYFFYYYRENKIK